MQQRTLGVFLQDNSAPGAIVVGEGMSSSAVYKLVMAQDMKRLIKPRKSFTHKGTYGHVLIVAGQEQTMGAALLCAKGCLHAGAGLTTACIPASGLTSLNAALPEVMYVDRDNFNGQGNTDKFTTIAIGPGLGQEAEAKAILKQLLAQNKPLVIDADAINLLAKDQEMFKQIPKGSVLTPHVKEFDGLFGEHHAWFHRIQTAREMAKKYQIVILLKNEFSFVIDQNSNVFINPTGNAGMAQGGMGDVLTGIVAAFMAQGYAAQDAAVLACYVHGGSGDELATTRFCVTASEVAKLVPHILKGLLK
jgi:hydroxyethylthiazole kinase-like uncharacterized protein yjeF